MGHIIEQKIKDFCSVFDSYKSKDKGYIAVIP